MSVKHNDKTQTQTPTPITTIPPIPTPTHLDPTTVTFTGKGEEYIANRESEDENVRLFQNKGDNTTPCGCCPIWVGMTAIGLVNCFECIVCLPCILVGAFCESKTQK